MATGFLYFGKKRLRDSS